jgi:flagellar motor switch protein FliN
METEEGKQVVAREHAGATTNVFSAIPVTVQVMLGTATLPLADLMRLQSGSDLVLDQSIGEPVTVIVNGTRIARGELFVFENNGDRLGVRITEILSGNPA